MIIYYDVPEEEIQNLQKTYPWKRPDACPHCKSKVWGHGFVQRFFNRVTQAIFVKRWICSKCKIVFTTRPKSHWRRYQESISHIFAALIMRLQHYIWPPWTTRQRGGHWLRKIVQNAKANNLFKSNIFETINFYKEKCLAIF